MILDLFRSNTDTQQPGNPQPQPTRGVVARAGRLRRRVSGWVWAPILGKLLLWCGAFVALAYVGSGTASRLLGMSSPTLAPNAAGAALSWTQPIRPASGSAAPAASAVSSGAKKKHPAPITEDGKVVLNLATDKELVGLPGIGPKRARAILELRSRLGGFRRVEQLLRVRGIGHRLLRRLRPLVVVDPPPKA